MAPTLRLLPFALFLIILPFPGTVAARLLLLVMCFSIALWLWWRVPASRAPLPCKPALGAWLAICLASLAYAFDPAYTLGELKNELGYTMMAFFAFFAIAHDRGNAVWLLRASGLGVVVIGTWAIVALVANGMAWNERGGHGGTGIFATFTVTVVAGQIWLVREDPSLFMRRTAVGLSCFTLVLAATTMQRVVWPVIALQLLIGLLMAKRAGFVTISRRLLLTAIGCAAVATVVGLVAVQKIRHSENEQVQLSTDVRIAFWPKVVGKIVEHPLTGTGFGRDVIRKAYPDLTPAEAPTLWHGHNVFLNYGLEIGVPGMLALIAMFASFGSLFWRASTGASAWTGLAGLLLIAAVVMRNQFNDFFIRDMSLMFWALAGLFARLAITKVQGNNNDQQTPA